MAHLPSRGERFAHNSSLTPVRIVGAWCFHTKRAMGVETKKTTESISSYAALFLRHASDQKRSQTNIFITQVCLLFFSFFLQYSSISNFTSWGFSECPLCCTAVSLCSPWLWLSLSGALSSHYLHAFMVCNLSRRLSISSPTHLTASLAPPPYTLHPLPHSAWKCDR